jgi:hypothetical protein
VQHTRACARPRAIVDENPHSAASAVSCCTAQFFVCAQSVQAVLWQCGHATVWTNSDMQTDASAIKGQVCLASRHLEHMSPFCLPCQPGSWAGVMSRNSKLLHAQRSQPPQCYFHLTRTPMTVAMLALSALEGCYGQQQSACQARWHLYLQANRRP